jgi:hypothetical protein
MYTAFLRSTFPCVHLSYYSVLRTPGVFMWQCRCDHHALMLICLLTADIYGVLRQSGHICVLLRASSFRLVVFGD